MCRILCPDCNNKDGYDGLIKEALGSYVIYYCWHCLGVKMVDLERGQMVNSPGQLKLLEL